GGGGEGLVGAADLVGDLGDRDEPLRDAHALGVEHERGADGHAGGHGDGAFQFHVPGSGQPFGGGSPPGSSPGAASSSASAGNASAASSPVTSRVSSLSFSAA